MSDDRIDVKGLGRVAVLMGGRSAERELAELKSDGVDRVFIALHGRGGEDGTVQGALEWLRLPYTGSGVMASAIAMDKVMTKRVWAAVGLPTPPSVTLAPHEQTDARIADIPAAIGLPLMVKPPREGSSIGITKVGDAAALAPAVREAARHDPEVLCEAFVDGLEITCPVIGEGEQAQALPIIRIAAPDGNYDYQNKYFTDVVQYHCPSGLPADEEAAIQAIVLQAYRVLGCRGWGRADLMLRASDRKPFLLEMNTSPGMTGHSLVPMSAKAAGISYEQLCLRLLASAALDHA